jgi:succinate dehydrogenase/fumarate reductase flavoprotein subunit
MAELERHEYDVVVIGAGGAGGCGGDQGTWAKRAPW